MSASEGTAEDKETKTEVPLVAKLPEEEGTSAIVLDIRPAGYQFSEDGSSAIVLDVIFSGYQFSEDGTSAIVLDVSFSG